MTSHRRPSPPDTGQAALEVALALPVVLVGMLAVVQVAVLAADLVAVEHAARAGARAAAAAGSSGAAACAAAARRSTPGLAGDHLTTTFAVAGDAVVCRVTYLAPTDVPLLGGWMGAVTIAATARYAPEPP